MKFIYLEKTSHINEFFLEDYRPEYMSQAKNVNVELRFHL